MSDWVDEEVDFVEAMAGRAIVALDGDVRDALGSSRTGDDDVAVPLVQAFRVADGPLLHVDVPARADCFHVSVFTFSIPLEARALVTGAPLVEWRREAQDKRAGRKFVVYGPPVLCAVPESARRESTNAGEAY